MLSPSCLPQGAAVHSVWVVIPPLTCLTSSTFSSRAPPRISTLFWSFMFFLLCLTHLRLLSSLCGEHNRRSPPNDQHSPMAASPSVLRDSGSAVQAVRVFMPPVTCSISC